ncbi:hypothetical protein Droror1_Dr00021913 [Drosera rotundifolia]
MIVPPKTQLHRKPAPFMASFTSRGPNVIDPNILKPDITAPGLNILAAWSGADAPTKLSEDPRRVKWNFLSGTSMSCPHFAATAVLITAIHPTWSSAAIRSAIMTTASFRNNAKTMITDAAGKPGDPFQFGSGHIWPSKAPILVLSTMSPTPTSFSTYAVESSKTLTSPSSVQNIYLKPMT